MLLVFARIDRKLLYADPEAIKRFSLNSSLVFPEKTGGKDLLNSLPIIVSAKEIGLCEEESENADYCLKVSCENEIGREIIKVAGVSASETAFAAGFDGVSLTDRFLQQIFSSPFYSVVIVDCLGKIINANATSLKNLNYSRDEIIGQKIVELLHKKEEISFLRADIQEKFPETAMGDFQAIVFAGNEDQVKRHVFTWCRSDGSDFHVSLNVFPIVDKENEVVGYAEIAIDLSAFLETENRLEVSEKTMTTVIESAVDGVIIIDEKGTILGFNKAAANIFLIPVQKAIGKNVAILMPEPHRSKHGDYVKRYLDSGIAHVVGIGRKVEAVRSNGEVFPIDLAVGEVNLGNSRIFTGFVRDLTETSRLESERDSFFQMSLDLFCILDSAGVIRSANPRWLDVLGYTPEEICGTSLVGFLHPEDLSYDPELVNEIVSSKEVLEKSFRFRAHDGTYRWLLWNSSADKKNHVVYGVARDITNQRQTIEELKHSKAESERLSEARGLFIAKMSHELRTPLNSIIGFSGILKKNLSGGFSEKDILYLDRIKRNGAALLKLINGILEYSRAESGFQEIYPEDVSVRDLVEEIVDLMQVTIEEKNANVILKLPEKVSVIKTDQVKFRQIVQNLIDNAVKFSEGGKVEIDLEIDPVSGSPIKLSIKDSGPGISEEHLERIFEAFQQCDDTVTRRYGGAGLGLAIARSFARLLGFTIDLTSKPGEGSCFSVIFEKS